jgi:hypothetical protein
MAGSCKEEETNMSDETTGAPSPAEREAEQGAPGSPVTLRGDMPVAQPWSDARFPEQVRGRVRVHDLPLGLFTEFSERTCRENRGLSLESVRKDGGLDADECLAVLAGFSADWASNAGLGADVCHRLLYAVRAAYNRGRRSAGAPLSDEERGR